MEEGCRKSCLPTRVLIQNDDENIPLTKIQTSRAGAESRYENCFDEADIDHDAHLDHREYVVILEDLSNVVVSKRKRKESEELDLRTMWKLWWPPRLEMIIISCFQIFFFFIDESKKGNSAMGPIGKLFIYDPMKRYEFWRYLTYMFVHRGYDHLIQNLVVQISLSNLLEKTHGWWRVLVIYLAGVVAGSLGTSITNPTRTLAGASGGAFSILTAHIAAITMNWPKTRLPEIQLTMFVLVTVVTLGFPICSSYWFNEADQTAHTAHFIGALAGFLVGVVVLKNLKLTEKENVTWWIAAAVYMILMLVGICWNIFYSDYFPKQI
ncbi:protein rhomboid-like [Zophobas morio]|uniref:protein rhomboid-like n=1 Tax=Zophobas morio TaxID=2755281 RepID=UPI00308357AA